MISVRLATQSREETHRRRRPVDQRDDSADPMTPAQYYDMVSRRQHHDGETRLLFAVLEDAIRCYATAKNSVNAAQQREFQEVKAWVNTRGDHDVFSFDSICTVFSIEPETLRSQLNTMRIDHFPARRMRTVGRRTALSIPD